MSDEARSRDLLLRKPRAAKMGIVTGEQIAPIERVLGQVVPEGFDLPDLLEACIEPGLEKAIEASKTQIAVGCVFPAPPVIRPTAFLDFYTFEQHVSTCRAKRGLDVVPEWYQVPAYYNSNASALFGHGQEVYYPPEEDRLDYELELACVIGKPCRNVTVEEAAEYIAGYTILNDLSARSLQKKVMAIGLGPARGKDHGSSLGPWFVTADEVKAPRNLAMRAFVNGEKWSEGNSGMSHFTFEQMVAFASRTRTLYPGDVLGSGTVGTGCGLEQDRFLSPGDTIRLEIDELGTLENKVSYEPISELTRSALKQFSDK